MCTHTHYTIHIPLPPTTNTPHLASNMVRSLLTSIHRYYNAQHTQNNPLRALVFVPLSRPHGEERIVVHR